MKQTEGRAKHANWRKKGPVAKRIWHSYLAVLLLPFLLTIVITAATVMRLQSQSYQHVASISTELSRVLSAYFEEIQASNSRILISDEARQLSVINPGSFTPSEIRNLRSLQKQLPRDTVSSDYIRAIYVCFLKSGTILTAAGVYYDYNASHMLKNELGLSLEQLKAYIESVPDGQISLVTGAQDHRGHILISRRLASKGGLSDVVVLSEFRSEKALLLMKELSENGDLIHTLTGENGSTISLDIPDDAMTRYKELKLPVGSSEKIGITLRTLIPKNRFLRQTIPFFLGLFLCFLFFAAGGWFLIHYFTKRQYTPIMQLNASLLASLNRSASDTERGLEQNEFDQMTEAVSSLLQTNASYRVENEQLRENIRRHLLHGILFGNIRKEEIILRHTENNGIQFAGQRFIVVLYAIEDLQQDEQSHLIIQNEETISRLDEIVRTAISRLADNGCTRYAVEVEEQVACIISLPDALTEEQFWHDVIINIQQVREFFRSTFGLILTAAVSGLHSGVVSITTCFRECREASDYMELIGSGMPFCRYDQIPFVANDALSFPEVLEKEKKLCRNLSTGDYKSALCAWDDVCEALALRKCSSSEARIRLLGVVSLMSSSLNDIPPGLEDSVHLAFNTDLLQLMPDLDSMLTQISNTLFMLANHANEEKPLPENSADQQYICYVNEHITDPNISISIIADHFNMSTSYFSKRFKKAAGESLLDYIHRERLTLAKQIMAEQPEATLKDICDVVGYTSPLTLNRAFRKYEGITPSDYRAHLHASETV